jgi:hypothetical protein
VPQSRTGPFGKANKLLPLLRIEPKFLDLAAHMLVIIRTAPDRLLLVKRRFNIFFHIMLQWELKDLANDGHVSLSYKFLERIKRLVKSNCDSELNIFRDQEKDRRSLSLHCR